MKSPCRNAAVPVLVAAMLLLLPSSVKPQAVSAVENLRAFAKLYGYVKYFHPSDAAAETDWDAFAIYGAERVLGVESRDELNSTLHELFRGAVERSIRLSSRCPTRVKPLKFEALNSLADYRQEHNLVGK